MRQVKTLLHLYRNLIFIFLIFCFAFEIDSQKIKAQSGSGRTATASVSARKKVSKPVKVEPPKPVKKTAPKTLKAPMVKTVEPTKIIERPRQVALPNQVVFPTINKNKAAAAKPVIEEPVKEVVQSQREVEKTSLKITPAKPELKKVVLQGKRDITNNDLIPLVPTAKIERIQIYQNVYENLIKGIRIHVKFRTINLEQTEALLTAFFYHLDDDTNSNNGNRKHSARIDTPFVEDTFTPTSKESIFSNYTLFIPYSELERAYGSYDNKSRFKVKMQIQISEINGGLLAASSYNYITIE